MGRRRAGVERALALVRQGQDSLCTIELERVLERWDVPDEEEGPAPSGLELDLPELEMPVIAVSDDGAELIISDGWGIDEKYLSFVIERLQELAYTKPGSEVVASRAMSFVRDGIWQKKIWKVG